MLHSKLTEKIIACAYKVYNKMGYGYLESVYGKCMLIELAGAGLNDVGLILNFAKDKVEVKRKVKDL